MSCQLEFVILTWNLWIMNWNEICNASSTGNEICDESCNPNEIYDVASRKWIEICRMKSSEELGTKILWHSWAGIVANAIISPLEVSNEITSTTEVWNEMESVV